MKHEIIEELHKGFETAYINGLATSNNSYKPRFISNNYKEGKKVLSSIEDELLDCENFQISVAFITMGGLIHLLPTLKKLDEKGVRGEILTTNYLNYSQPAALQKLHELKNITLKMYDVDLAGTDFHTKGYIFKKKEVYCIIIGSSNLTGAALTENKEWNTKIISARQGEVCQELLDEFYQLWNSDYAREYECFYESYKLHYEIIEKQRRMARQETLPSLEKYKLKPNSMQVEFIKNLKTIIASGEDRALLISATGTGKTFASAFAMRELQYKRVLFLVHRAQLARQTIRSYKKVFGKNVSMGLVGAGNHEYDKDYVFATVQTLNREEHLLHYNPNDFDCIILDEAHHSSANSYQIIMNYFKPQLWLGLTATPDKREDEGDSGDIYKIFHYQIAYEIRLQQAMEEKMLCPFHYFGISDISVIDDKKIRQKNISEKDFNHLISEERVKHIVEQAKYYGYSGNRVKGLVFCSRVEETKELSKKFNNMGYRTISLNGDASEKERMEAFEKLAMDEEDTTDERTPLDYIFSVDILNEGVDIVEVNQVIMLRPTQSPIVFIQQLGRGLRKAEGKEYVVILDFIGNYSSNFMIPIALSGDRTYNPDTIRKYMISGNRTIPGESTIYFDEVAKEKIFHSINKIRGIKAIIKDSYFYLKNKLGRIPYLLDFYENGEIDPLVIIKEYKTFFTFLEKMEKGIYKCTFSTQEKLILEYLSKTVLNGSRPYELEILNSIIIEGNITVEDLNEEFLNKYGYKLKLPYLENAVNVLQGHFVSNRQEYQKYCHIEVLEYNENVSLNRVASFANCLRHKEFYEQVHDIVLVGLRRYKDKYWSGEKGEMPFVLYEKYSRRDVSLLMNCGKDLSSTMYGMKRIGDDVFIFVTYHKEKADDGKKYVDGKPDYADAFEDNLIFRWDSKIGMGIKSIYMQSVITAKRKHLFIKKSDAEIDYYYMGQFSIETMKEAQKENNRGKYNVITKVQARMHNPVRDDLLHYLQSKITIEENVG